MRVLKLSWKGSSVRPYIGVAAATVAVRNKNKAGPGAVHVTAHGLPLHSLPIACHPVCPRNLSSYPNVSLNNGVHEG